MAPTTPADLRMEARFTPRSPSTAPVAVGEVIANKYVVERVLGAGGMGVVVCARHVTLEQRVALKFLLPTACEVPGAVSRFIREGRAAARITSEHVARVLDTATLDNGAPYLVLEYLEGQDLGAITQARGKLPWAEAVAYVLQACEAIVEAHSLGIVHRDLKPANLFVTRRADGSPLVKVLDFGISKVEGGSSPQLTSASMLMGSPRYMSPEQMLSAKDVDARTDIWALGVVLFELVTGRPVWQADSVQGLCARIASEPAPRLTAFVSKVPPALDAVVQRCLAKSRDERLSSVRELALALAPLAPPEARLSVARIVAISGDVRGASGAHKTRTPLGWVALIAAVVALLGGGAGFVRGRSASRAEATSAVRLTDAPLAPLAAPSAQAAAKPDPNSARVADAPSSRRAPGDSPSVAPSTRASARSAPPPPTVAAQPVPKAGRAFADRPSVGSAGRPRPDRAAIAVARSASPVAAPPSASMPQVPRVSAFDESPALSDRK